MGSNVNTTAPHIINFILAVNEPDTGQFSAADMNDDDALNIQDVILMVNIILG